MPISRNASLASTSSLRDLEVRPGVWVEAARPKTLTAAVSPVIVGTAAAETFIAWRFAAALLVALALQVAVNYANDLSDAARGVDTQERSGPRRAVAAGLVTPAAMKIAIVLALALAAAVGLSLTVAVGPELLVVGAASILAALLYSGGPRPYGSYGLGELFVFVFFGLVATAGSAYVQDETLTQIAYVAAVPVGFLATAILVANNLRDLETDTAARKRTLAVRLGENRTRLLYQGLVIVAFLSTGAVAATDGSFLPILALVAVPFAVRPVSLVLYGREPNELIEALAGTARLELIYAALLAAGLWAS
jgi:1,4-dihydroxy-2-naphthoate octaprenyltransferase